ncbi:MAG: hypothetical protein ACK419_00950, partial [Pyrinomonadaceae bacterium]
IVVLLVIPLVFPVAKALREDSVFGNTNRKPAAELSETVVLAGLNENVQKSLDVKLTLPERILEGENFIVEIKVSNTLKNPIALTEVVLEKLPAQSFRGMSDITYYENIRPMEARAPQVYSSGYSSVEILMPGKAKEIRLRAKGMIGGKAVAKVYWIPINRDMIYISTAKEGIPSVSTVPPTFRKLNSDEAIPENATLKNNEIPPRKMVTAEASFAPSPREYSLKKASGDANLNPLFTTFYVPSGHWVISDGLVTAFCRSGEVHKVKGNHVSFLEDLDLSDTDSKNFSGILSNKDKKLRKFLERFNAVELLGKDGQTRIVVTVTKAQVVDFIVGLDNLGYSLNGGYWKRR